MIIRLFDVVGFRPKADGSASLTITTAFEQAMIEKAELLDLYQKRCMIAIKEGETPFLDSQIEDLDSVEMDLEDKSKTPSKRLRGVLWRLQEQELKRPPTNDEFKEFYKNRMEKLISQIKERLEP